MSVSRLWRWLPRSGRSEIWAHGIRGIHGSHVSHGIHGSREIDGPHGPHGPRRADEWMVGRTCGRVGGRTGGWADVGNPIMGSTRMGYFCFGCISRHMVASLVFFS